MSHFMGRAARTPSLASKYPHLGTAIGRTTNGEMAPESAGNMWSVYIYTYTYIYHYNYSYIDRSTNSSIYGQPTIRSSIYPSIYIWLDRLA